MDSFDGFIAAIASEFKIKFHKNTEGAYTTTLQFENNRSQEVLVALGNDESGDRTIHYYSIIAKLKIDSIELYKYALQLNSTLDYGAIAIRDKTLILMNSELLHHCEPDRFVKSLLYIGAKADEIEENLENNKIN